MTRLCLSIGNPEDLFSSAVPFSDLLEIRADRLGGLPEDLPDKPLLITLGDANHKKREDICRQALDRGALLIDIGDRPVRTPIENEKVMMSHHDWNITPSTEGILEIMSNLDGSIRKGAFMINGYDDLMSIMRASKSLRGARVLIGMGELGAVTRIRSNELGNEFTFAHGGRATAPGQLPLQEMRSLGDHPLLLGVTGRPLGHSLSPPMHRAALESCGLQGKYLRFDVPDIEHICEFMRSYDIKGMNVTIPYKVRALELMDSLDDTAEAVGAINTISNEDGLIVGYNTDVMGIKEALTRGSYRSRGGKALVIGSGGAARACCHALMTEGASVAVTGRSPEKAKALADRFGCEQLIKVEDVASFDLVVNCTPLGMEGFPDDAPLDTRELVPGQIVFDMVYRPRETPLIREAIVHGADVIEGIEMLIHQARASFRIWTGHDVPPTVMREAVL